VERSYAVGWLRHTMAERRYLVASAIAMSVGIGANGAIFSFLVTTLIDPLPVQEPGTLVAPHTVWPGGLFNNFSHSQYS